MSVLIDLQLKLRKAWLKLLKAEVKRKTDKVAKWEKRIIELELMVSQLKEK